MVDFYIQEQREKENRHSESLMVYLKQKQKIEEMERVAENYNAVMNSSDLVSKRAYKFHNEGKK